jgi:hypothetical protein
MHHAARVVDWLIIVGFENYLIECAPVNFARQPDALAVCDSARIRAIWNNGK